MQWEKVCCTFISVSVMRLPSQVDEFFNSSILQFLVLAGVCSQSGALKFRIILDFLFLFLFLFPPIQSPLPAPWPRLATWQLGKEREIPAQTQSCPGKNTAFRYGFSIYYNVIYQSRYFDKSKFIFYSLSLYNLFVQNPYMLSLKRQYRS